MFGISRRHVPASTATTYGKAPTVVSGAGSTLSAYAAEYRRAMALAAQAEQCANDVRRMTKLIARLKD